MRWVFLEVLDRECYDEIWLLIDLLIIRFCVLFFLDRWVFGFLGCSRGCDFLGLIVGRWCFRGLCSVRYEVLELGC